MYPWLKAQYQALGDRAAQGKLHHGLLLQGIAGIGKRHMARTLASDILCKSTAQSTACGNCQSCHLMAAESHPDLQWVEAEKQIGVDAVRAAIQQLSGTAQMSGAKVLILCGAESMTEAAANALLKTLEEPTDNTFIVLVADDASRLMPTIISRCERVVLHPPALQQGSDWLRTQTEAVVEPATLRSYGNAVLRLLADIEDDSQLTYQQFSAQLASLSAGATTVNELADLWSNDASRVLNWLQLGARDALLQGATLAKLAFVEACTAAQGQLHHPGLNRSLLLSGLLLQFQQLEKEE